VLQKSTDTNCCQTRNGILTIFQKQKKKEKQLSAKQKTNYKHIGQRQPGQAHSGPTHSAYPSSPGRSGASADCGELARQGFLLLRPPVALHGAASSLLSPQETLAESLLISGMALDFPSFLRSLLI
jgi:hypothetical protein